LIVESVIKVSFKGSKDLDVSLVPKINLRQKIGSMDCRPGPHNAGQKNATPHL